MGSRHLPAKSKTPHRVKFPSSWAKRVMATPSFLNTSLDSLLLLTTFIFLSSQIKLQLFLLSVCCKLTFAIAGHFWSQQTEAQKWPSQGRGQCHVRQVYSISYATKKSKHICYKEIKMHLTKFFKIINVHVLHARFLRKKGKSACKPFSPKPQPLNSPGQHSVWSFSIALGSADEETVAPEGPVTDGNQSSWRAGKCLCGCGGGGRKPIPLPSFKAACSHHALLQTQPTDLLGRKLKEAVCGQMI